MLDKVRALVAAAFILTLATLTSVGAEQTAEPRPAKEQGSYLIGVEDVLKIVTWGEPDLTVTGSVLPDGTIILPLINEIHVAGLTPEQARTKITAEMSNFIRDPNVSVIIEEIRHFRVYFLGEISTQGPQQFSRPTRLLQAIATAGGLTDFADKRITILREEYGIEKRIDVDYKKLWAGDPAQENIFLRPGDTVLVK